MEDSSRELMDAIQAILDDSAPSPMPEIPPLADYEVLTVLDTMPFDGKSSVLGALRSILMREASAQESLSEKERKWLNSLSDSDREWLNSLLVPFGK